MMYQPKMRGFVRFSSERVLHAHEIQVKNYAHDWPVLRDELMRIRLLILETFVNADAGITSTYSRARCAT